MEENNKLFVFEKKEVILIFLFIALISIISFTLGVRLGKQLSLKHDQFNSEDVSKINLKSVEEESVEKVVEDSTGNGFEESMDQEKRAMPSKSDPMELRLKEEMEKLANEDVEVMPSQVDREMSPRDVEPSVETARQDDSQSPYQGKYTIQIFADQSHARAQEFADGFIVKGYDVVINEVVIPGKGKWYRVGVGIFDTINQAKEYLDKEKGTFQTKNYIIRQL